MLTNEGTANQIQDAVNSVTCSFGVLKFTCCIATLGVVKQLTLHLKPSQKHIIITGDQPVYALGKQVQWMYPEQFPDVLWMMAPLLIEIAFSDAMGNWLDGSGWTDLFERAKITTPVAWRASYLVVK